MARTACRSHRSLTIAVVCALVAALTVTALVTSPAQAVEYAAPTGLSPVGGSFSTNPTLTWNRVPGASTYRVDLSTSDTFTTLVAGAGISATVNNRWVPTVQLPAGTIYWRVSANGGTPVNWSVGEFTREAVGVPELLTPADGGTIQAPTEPEGYSWTPVPGAISYNLQIGDDDTFTDPARYTTYSTQRAGYTLKSLPAPGTKYWRVQAVLAATVKSDWSEPRSVVIDLFGQDIPLQPQAPANDPNAAVDDVVLDWEPIAGAVRYDLQVSLDDQFLSLAHSRTGIASTRYSPPGVLANDQYWWRVRPVDAAGHAAPWAAMPVWTFQRHWPNQASLQYPADGATIDRADRMFFQWSGIHLAGSYTLELATDPSFGGTLKTCTTVNTTLTPMWPSADACMPVVGTTYYWRVRAKDTPAAGSASPETNPLAPDAQVRSFTFMPHVVDNLAPADGAFTDLPILRWAALSGAETYRVQVWDTADGVRKVDARTFGTSLTPRVALLAGHEYRWQVEAFADSGAQISNPLLPLFQDTFTVVAPIGSAAGTPDALGSPMTPMPRVPTMLWSRTENATKYTLRIKRAENPTWTTQIANLVYPAGEDWTTANLAAGTYDFQVEAFNGASTLGLGSAGQFTVSAPTIVTGHQAALVGTDIDSSDTARSCNAELPNTCQNLRQTPVLAWDPNPHAASYQLILSADPVLTDSVDRKVTVYGTMWSDVATLADANAASGTYWAVISCVATCVPTGAAEHVFNKQAPGVTLTSPDHDTSGLSDEVTLTWQDWLATPHLLANTPLTATAPTTEARYYQVQTATKADFTSGILDSSVQVDQTTYTSASHVYPDGPIYWRVRAFDGSARASAWSGARSFTVASPSPTQMTPAAGATLAPGSSFTWEPLPFAASYELKVLKNDGTSIDTAPAGSVALSVTGIQQTSYAPTAFLPVLPLTDGNNYRWFLRRKTVSGGVGPWTDGIAFRVVGQAPALSSPSAGAIVPPKGALFTWGSVSGAASYRFEHRAVGGGSAVTTTVALAHAPTTVLPTGAREWRVAAYDASGNPLGASGWRAYSAPPITGTASISGTASVGGTLTASGSWTPTGVTVTRQWYASGTAIPGATAATYTVRSADVGKSITVKVTGAKSGYTSVTVTSNAITATATATVTNTARPAISGTAKIGYTLTASRGSWSPAPDSYTYQWLRNGGAITGATASTYKVTSLDPGRSLTVRVVARKAGYTSGVSSSLALAVPRVTTTTSAAFVDSTITAATYPQMRVTVLAPGIANPTGDVRIYEGTTLLRTVTLGTTSAGKVTVTLPRRTRGSHYLHAKYMGSSYTLSSTSAKRLLSVS